jgi:hypothetical protein
MLCSFSYRVMALQALSCWLPHRHDFIQVERESDLGRVEPRMIMLTLFCVCARVGLVLHECALSLPSTQHINLPPPAATKYQPLPAAAISIMTPQETRSCQLSKDSSQIVYSLHSFPVILKMKENRWRPPPITPPYYQRTDPPT